jgi:hypothetical protein
MVTIDWDHIGEITRRQYRSFTRTISLGMELTRNYFYPASEGRRSTGPHSNEAFHRDEGSDEASDNSISCTRCLKSPPEVRQKGRVVIVMASSFTSNPQFMSYRTPIETVCVATYFAISALPRMFWKRISWPWTTTLIVVR